MTSILLLPTLRQLIIPSSVFALSLLGHTALATTLCNSLDSCLKDLQTSAAGDWGLGPPDDRIEDIAKRLEAYGDRASRKLLILVEKGSPEARKAASYALGKFHRIAGANAREIVLTAVRDGVCSAAVPGSKLARPEDVPMFIALMRQKCREAPPALAALGKAGAKALAEAVHDPLLPPFIQDLAVQAIWAMPCNSQVDVSSLLEAVLDDQHEDTAGRGQAALALGGLSKCRAIPPPNALKKGVQSPDHKVRRASIAALSNWADPIAVAALVEDVKSGSADPWPLFKLAQLGQAAKPSIPAISAYLRQGPWDGRSQAVIALGRIGGPDAENAIVKALDGPSWRTTICAVRTLANIPASHSAVKRLGELATQHWYRLVRLVAQKAHAYLVSRGKASSAAGGPIMPLRPCGEGEDDTPVPAAWKHCEGYSRNGQPIPPFPLPEPPSAILETDDGYYVGTNLGEFGGKLRFRSKRGGQWETLIDEHPVHSLLRFGNSIVAAIVGVFDDTHLYRFSVARGPIPRIPWLDLPGMPFGMGSRSNKLIMETSAGVFEISDSGEIREGSCGSWSK